MLNLAPGNPPTDAKDTNISSVSLCSYPSFVATTFSSGNHFGFKSYADMQNVLWRCFRFCVFRL